MADSDEVAAVYFAVSNIPSTFRSADLRNYFSQFIESGGFVCFHYRHRPEIIREAKEGPEAVDQPGGSSSTADRGTGSGSVSSVKGKAKSCCCVVSVREPEADRFVRLYARNHWINSKGNWLARRCVVKRVKVSNDNGEFVVNWTLSEKNGVLLFVLKRWLHSVILDCSCCAFYTVKVVVVVVYLWLALSLLHFTAHPA